MYPNQGMEIQGVNTTRNDLFPFSALRVLGSLQIAIGTVCIGLGILDLTLLLMNYDESLLKYSAQPDLQKAFDTLVSLTVASAPIWCGTWYVVTGSLGTCVSRERSHSLKFMKITFLVLSVLCAAFFAPACGVMSCIIAVIHHTLDYGDVIWLVPTAVAFLSFCEMGIAILSASVSCCCAPLRLAKVQTDPPKPPPDPQPVQQRSYPGPRRYPEPDFRHRPGEGYPVLRQLPPEPSYPYPPRSSGSMGYDRLRRWALPHDDVIY
ncbi:hypothetical protein BaRGS_00017733 [Batillaria attramentaria]|uniref:Transmembrane protein n=1 Tax=Batillaria attramentaria TaxID=370345 RepID=A0ABD0KW92_9CAEN